MQDMKRVWKKKNKTNEKKYKVTHNKKLHFFTHTHTYIYILCRAVQYYRFFFNDIYDGKKILKSIFLIAKKRYHKN